jgi:hypothetical protein
MTAVDEETRKRERFRRGEGQIAFLHENQPRLRKKYPDKFVVFDCTNVLDADDDLVEVMRKVEAKGIRVGRDVWVHFFPADVQAWMRSWRP